MNKTISYYNNNAKLFTNDTLDAKLTDTQDLFLSYLNKDALILDFGCGSGRDTKYFLSKGFKVEAIDGSIELCKIASINTGIAVKNMFFQDLNEINKYDGIWACSSILHLNKTELKEVLIKMISSLKDNGIIYTSFKYSNFEGERNGRYFTDFTEDSFNDYTKDLNINVIKEWVSNDVRPNRNNEKWLNIILKK